VAGNVSEYVSEYASDAGGESGVYSLNSPIKQRHWPTLNKKQETMNDIATATPKPELPEA
jgi:hypothetical protein